MTNRIHRSISDPLSSDEGWLKREGYPALRDTMDGLNRIVLPSDYRHINGANGLSVVYASGNPGGTNTGMALAQDTIHVVPFIAPYRGGALDALLFETTANSDAGDGVRIGIYENTEYGVIYPSNLRYGSDEIATITNTVYTQAITEELVPGELIWLAIARNSNSSLTARGVTGTIGGILGAPTTLGSQGHSCISVASTYGALPDPFPTGGALATTAPTIFCRFSA